MTNTKNDVCPYKTFTCGVFSMMLWFSVSCIALAESQQNLPSLTVKAALEQRLIRLKNKPEYQQVESINQFFNQLTRQRDREIWGKDDYWATPDELMTLKKGDCEDLAIAKYFVLRRLGISNNRLHLAYGKSFDAEMNIILKELSKKPTKEFDSTDFTPSGWNKRNKEYQLKIQGGSLFDLVCIYRDIMHLTKYKELSFGERNLLQLAEDLIVQEILIVQHKKRSDIVKDLRSKFQDISFPGGIGAQSSSSALI